MNILTSLFTDHKHPVPPAAFHPGKPMWIRKVLWWLRNPLADFTSFYIGLKGKDSEIVVHRYIYSQTGEIPTFRPGGGGFQWVVHKYKKLYFPFVSYANSGQTFKAYLGWRPSGAFGIKFQVHFSRIFK